MTLFLGDMKKLSERKQMQDMILAEIKLLKDIDFKNMHCEGLTLDIEGI